MGIEPPTQEQLDSPSSKIQYGEGFAVGNNEFTDQESTGIEPSLLSNVPDPDEVEESEGLKQAPEPLVVGEIIDGEVTEPDESKSGEEVPESDEGSVPLVVEPTVDAEDLSLKVDDA